MLDLLLSGEPFLFANIGVLLFAIALTAQRVHSLWMKYGASSREMLRQVMGFVEGGSYARALQLCNAADTPVATIFKAALMRANRSEREIRRAVEMTAIEQLPKMKKGTGYMPQLSNLATLLGLIGTIRGLIVSFSGVSGGDAAARQQMLAHGISIAFYNTFFGLTVAVVIIFVYMFILGRQNKLIAEMEFGTAQLVDQLLLNQSSGRQTAA